MSQFLSLSAFAAEVAWHQDDIMKLIAENKIKSYQTASHEPYIPRTELAKVKEMSYKIKTLNTKEERLIQDEADRVSRAYSRSKIAAERTAQDTETERRRLAMALKNAKRQHTAS